MKWRSIFARSSPVKWSRKLSPSRVHQPAALHSQSRHILKREHLLLGPLSTVHKSIQTGSAPSTYSWNAENEQFDLVAKFFKCDLLPTLIALCPSFGSCLGFTQCGDLHEKFFLGFVPQSGIIYLGLSTLELDALKCSRQVKWVGQNVNHLKFCFLCNPTGWWNVSTCLSCWLCLIFYRGK